MPRGQAARQVGPEVLEPALPPERRTAPSRDVTEKAGLSGMPQNRYGMGAAVGDYDNDGFPDLYVTSYGGNTLYRNNGDGTFRDVTAKAGVGGLRLERERRVLRLRQRRPARPLRHPLRGVEFEKNGYCGEKKPGYRAYCHPDNYEPTTNLLYRNNGDGTFTRRLREGGHRRGAAARGSASRSPTTTTTASWTSTWPTTPCSPSSSTTTATGRSREVGLLLGVGFNEDGKTFAGHGRGLRRLRQRRPARRRGHGPLERALPAVPPGRRRQLPGRHQRLGRGRRHARRSRAGARGFFDYDNDGWKDLFVAQGHVMDTIEKTAPNLRYLQPPLLLRNESGRFVRVAPGEAFQERLGRPRRRLRRPRQRRRRRRRGQQRGPARARAPQRRREPRPLARASARSGTTLEPRRHRLPREGGVRGRADPVLHRHHGRRATSPPATSGCWSGLGSAAHGRASSRSAGPPAPSRRCEDVAAGQTLDGRWSPRDDHPPQRCSRSSPGSAPSAFGQGVSSRGVRPQPRGKPSGRPFLSRFTDVAEKAGLTQPIVYGGIDAQELHHRGGRVRRGLLRLRQRRLARPARPERHAARGRAARAPRTASTRTTATAPSRT